MSLFVDGFELGDVPPWDASFGTPTRVNAPVHSGSWSLETNANGEALSKSFAVQTTLYVRWFFRVATLPAAGEELVLGGIYGNVAASPICRLYLRNDAGTQVLRLRRTYPADLGLDYNSAILADTWYCVEIRFVKNINGAYEVWLEEFQVIVEDPVDTSAAFDADTFYVGQLASNYAVINYSDDVEVNTGRITCVLAGPGVGGGTHYMIAMNKILLGG